MRYLLSPGVPPPAPVPPGRRPSAATPVVLTLPDGARYGVTPLPDRAKVTLGAGSFLLGLPTAPTVADVQAYLAAALVPTPQDTFAAAVAAGYTVPGVTPPLVLDLGDSARAQFTGLVVLLDKLIAAGQLQPDTPQAIADKSGALHSLPVSQIDTILLGYGAYYAGLYNTLHTAV